MGNHPIKPNNPNTNDLTRKNTAHGKDDFEVASQTC